jgi:hypothetical protein
MSESAGTSHFEVEPELMRSAPRRIRLRKPIPRAQLGCVAIFFLPFVCAGIFVLSSTIDETAACEWGREVDGRVLQLSDYEEEDSGYSVTYAYRLDDREYTNRSSVAYDSRNVFTPGNIVSVKVSPFLPGRRSVLPDSGRIKGRLTLGWVWSLGWNGILAAILGAVTYARRLSRRLIETGIPVVGIITDKKKAIHSDSTVFTVNYEFLASGSNATLEGEEKVVQSEWESVHIGDTRTVVYLREYPARNALYCFSAYKAV